MATLVFKKIRRSDFVAVDRCETSVCARAARNARLAPEHRLSKFFQTVMNSKRLRTLFKQAMDKSASEALKKISRLRADCALVRD